MANLNRFLTAKDIINTAAVECGLSALMDPVGSNDPTFKQLVQLLTSCGRELCVIPEGAWQHLIRSASIVTDGITDTYDLPTDFGSMIDQTGWETTSTNPLGGPLTTQLWSALVRGGNAVTSVAVSFRISEGVLEIYPHTTSGLTIEYDYSSIAWVYKEGDSATLMDHVETNTDTVLFPPILISKMLRYRFLAAKGFGTQEARAEYKAVLDSWTSRDKPAPILSLVAPQSMRFLDWKNVPESGYGH